MHIQLDLVLWRFITYDTVWSYQYGILDLPCDLENINRNLDFQVNTEIYDERFDFSPQYQACYKNSNNSPDGTCQPGYTRWLDQYVFR